MPRPTEAKIVRDGEHRYVNIQFTDHPRHEHFMDIEVRVENGGVSLRSAKYDGQIYFPLAALPAIVRAIREAGGEDA